MDNESYKKPDYGNWVSKKLLYVTGLPGLVLLGFSFLYIIIIIPALLFILVFSYLLYAHYKFSSRGGNLQERIRGLVLDYLGWDGQGEALDIGCGNGPLVIKMAQRYPGSKATGIDNWGGAWDYSQKECEKNAEIVGVSSQVAFQRASASRLPFTDGYFDAVVSNFVFHEVSDTKDKRDIIKEALRVVKKGGVFSFQDLFLFKRIYGDMDDLLATIQSWGVESVGFERTNDLNFIPGLLKLPFMVGAIGIIHGRK